MYRAPLAGLRASIRCDWTQTRQKIQDNYGYDRYPGNCHVVPNHALMVMALLHAPDDFQRGQMIVNTSGWDTDCNAGNLGCLHGIMLGLDGINNGPVWRGVESRWTSIAVRDRRDRCGSLRYAMSVGP